MVIERGQTVMYWRELLSLWELYAHKTLWCTSVPGVELHGLVSEQCKDMSWQGKDPSTNFRGGGFISLDNLLFFAKTFPGHPVEAQANSVALHR
ncbi:hypothetical protein ACLOJK_002632 [Asimina triloba]